AGNSTPRDASFIATIRPRNAVGRGAIRTTIVAAGSTGVALAYLYRSRNVPWLAAVRKESSRIVSPYLLQMDPIPSMTCVVSRRRTQTAKLSPIVWAPCCPPSRCPLAQGNSMPPRHGLRPTDKILRQPSPQTRASWHSCTMVPTTRLSWLSASPLGDQLEGRRNHLRAALPIRRVVGPPTLPRSPCTS